MTQHQFIPLLDVRRQTATLRRQLDTAFARVLDHSQFIMGPEVKELEEKIAAYCGTRFAISCASGSDALLLPLAVLGAGPGDSVVTTPFTFFATGGSISRLGARPIFGEIETDTFNLDPNWLKDYLGTCSAEKLRNIKAIMPVHLFGQCADMSPINEVASSYEIPVIEDAAQAIGAEHNGRRAGSLGWCGAFSFFPSKNLGGLGDGGLIATDDPLLNEKLRIYRAHGGGEAYRHDYVGMNSRLDTLQAAALLVKLEHLETWTERRRENAATYRQSMPALCGDSVGLPLESPGSRHVYNQFTVRVADRNQVQKKLTAAGVGTAIYYPIPLHLQTCFRDLGYAPGDLPVAEAAANQVLSIPVEAGHSEADILAVSRALAAAVTK